MSSDPPETLVPVTSAALAGLATAAYRTPAIQGWITANTGAVLTTVHTAFRDPRAPRVRETDAAGDHDHRQVPLRRPAVGIRGIRHHRPDTRRP